MSFGLLIFPAEFLLIDDHQLSYISKKFPMSMRFIKSQQNKKNFFKA